MREGRATASLGVPGGWLQKRDDAILVLGVQGLRIPKKDFGVKFKSSLSFRKT